MQYQSLSRQQQFQFWDNCGGRSCDPLQLSSRSFLIGVKKQRRNSELGLLLQFQASGPRRPPICAATKFSTGQRQVSLNPFDQSLDTVVETRDKRKTSELKATLKGDRIFLIGMMGCGKSTVGKLLADALDYRFLDSDTMIEEASGGMTVAQIFREHNEDIFRDFETKALMGLSNKDHLVVATGGGIVVCPINWAYLRQGLTVYLEVPLEALAERVVAVGTGSRPLLGFTEDDAAHSKALTRLSCIFQSRAPLYREADITVSLYRLALSLGYKRVQELTPKMIADGVRAELYRYFANKFRNSKGTPAA